MDKQEKQSTEQLAESIYSEFPRITCAHSNRDSGAPDPSSWLAEKLAGMSPARAALVGFRLAQGTRETRSGDLNAAAVHALLPLVRDDEKQEPEYVCKECGGVNVHVAAWTDANTREVLDDFGSWGELDTTYCCDCGDNTGICTPEEFVELEAERKAEKAQENFDAARQDGGDVEPETDDEDADED